MAVIRVARLQRLPGNIGEFVNEIAEGFNGLYGAAAADHYRNTARGVFSANLHHPDVQLWGAFEGEDAAGLLLALRHVRWTEVSFIHVLCPYRGQKVEEALIEAAFRALLDAGTDRIISDWVPMGPLDLEEAFMRRGFERMDRRFMYAALPEPRLCGADLHSRMLEESRWLDAAECMVRAYASHPGRHLHPEMENLLDAFALIRRVAGGGYGNAHPEYLRAVWEQDACAGVVLGSAVMPDTGFVLQVAVDPACRGRGYGAALLRGLAAAFRRTGVMFMTLGVTEGNPAMHLYESLGFEPRRRVQAYVWRRTEKGAP